MQLLTIAAEDVRVDDHIYIEELARNPNHCWVNVRKVKRINCPQNHDNHARILIKTIDQEYLYPPQQIVSIQRFSE